MMGQLGRVPPHMVTMDGAAGGMNSMNPHFNHPFSITNLMGPPDAKMDLKMYESMPSYSPYGQLSPMHHHTPGPPQHHVMHSVKEQPLADAYYKSYTPHSTAAL
jgi:hypothetical protein